MKKLLLFLFGTITMVAQSQIVLDENDFANANDTVFIGRDNTVGFYNLGTVGGPQTWDYSQIVTRSINTYLFLNPQNTGYAADFPTANIAFDNGSVLVFLNKTSSGVEAVGSVASQAGIEIVADFNPTYNIINFPTTFGDQYSDTYAFDETFFVGLDTVISAPFVGNVSVKLDSVRFKRIVDFEANFDAFGTMILPDPIGSKEVLRSKYREITNDSTFLYLLDSVNINLLNVNLVPGWNLLTAELAAILGSVAQIDLGQGTGIDTIYTYDFYAKQSGFIHLRFNLTAENGVPANAEFVSDPSLLVGINEIKPKKLDVDIYPNPTSDIVNIKGQVVDFYNVRVVDMTGKQVGMYNNIKMNEGMSFGNLKTGIYFLEITNQKGQKSVQKLVVK
jgi:hypothetical protein